MTNTIVYTNGVTYNTDGSFGVVPYVKIRNYLWVYDNGKMTRRSTPNAMQLLPSADLYIDEHQLDELRSTINLFMHEPSDQLTMAIVESEIDCLLRKWSSERWWNMYSPDCIRISAADHYAMY